MIKVTVAELREDVEKYLSLAEGEEVVITRGAEVIGVLVGVRSVEDIDDFLLERDPRFLKRVADARSALRAGKGIPLNDLPE